MRQIVSRLALPALARPDKEALHGHRGQVVALTGLSGAGKSTLARLAESLLTNRGLSCAVLDGDAMRAGLCADLGFGPAARGENLRRLGETAAVLLDAGLVVLVAAIMPLAADRARLRAISLPGHAPLAGPPDRGRGHLERLPNHHRRAPPHGAAHLPVFLGRRLRGLSQAGPVHQWPGLRG
ncbi:MAG: adenylyl-sulfate kinase [Pseudomonadota bacterium]